MDRVWWATVHGVTKSLTQLGTHIVMQALLVIPLSLLDFGLCGYKNLGSSML